MFISVVMAEDREVRGTRSKKCALDLGYTLAPFSVSVYILGLLKKLEPLALV